MEKITELLSPLLDTATLILTWLDADKTFGFVSSLAAAANPYQLLALFLISSLLMIWRLNAIETKGFEGTVIGTLVMPYCSGFANLAFAYVMATTGGKAEMVLENCLVNNVTNLTLLLGIPALFWGMNLYRKKAKKPTEKIAHLSLTLTLIAMLFFSAVTWILARDGGLHRSDGLVLIGLFLFWQLFQIFEVMKTNIRKKFSISKWIFVDLALVIGAALGTYYSIERLVAWVSAGGGGLISYSYLGVISGLLMVIPNGMLAFYYSAIGRSDIAYSSQIGDAHICIPMCIGIYAVFSPVEIPPSFETGIWILLGAILAHLLFLGALGRLPRIAGALLAGSYVVFIFNGILR
ncbi:MAG: sodium:calcium symporter [Desulforhopalus sp.]